MSRLAVRNLSAGYGDFQALHEVSMDIADGEVVAVIGANGAGKSTLLAAIAGALPAQRATVLLDDEEVGGLSPPQLVSKGIALVPEGRRLFRSLTVEENLLLGASAGRPGPWNLERVYGVLPRLRERRRQASTSMSGGEQQMVAIGRALMSNPQVLMCDELSLGLSPKAVGDVYAILAQLRGACAMLVVEQDLRQALSFADRVFCLQEGRVTLSGRPGELNIEQIHRAYFGVDA